MSTMKYYANPSRKERKAQDSFPDDATSDNRFVKFCFVDRKRTGQEEKWRIAQSNKLGIDQSTPNSSFDDTSLVIENRFRTTYGWFLLSYWLSTLKLLGVKEAPDGISRSCLDEEIRIWIGYPSFIAWTSLPTRQYLFPVRKRKFFIIYHDRSY
jgi:hypothetical protein